jgi:hypothetical protein
MRRFLIAGCLTAAAVALLSPPAPALRIIAPGNIPLQQKLLTADAVVVGKVTGIEKEAVDLSLPGQPGKQPHTVAVVKVETALIGAKNVTHIKVAFPKPGEAPSEQPLQQGRLRPLPAPGRPGFGPVALTEGQEGVFFLSKHPGADGYYQINAGHLPMNASDGNYKDELAKVTASAAAFADPVKALSADKVEDRVQSALALAQRYRSYPVNNPTGVVQEEPLPTEESKLLVKVLLDADWAKTEAYKVADALGLLPGQYGIPDVLPAANEDANEVRQKAFKAWHAKFGDKFQVKKIAAKTKSGK